MPNSRNRVIYAGNTVLISNYPCWDSQTGDYDLKLLQRIQSSSISIDSPITRPKQIGSSDFAFDRYLNYPTVKVNLSYYLSDNSNELLFGFNATGNEGAFKNLRPAERDRNLFFVFSNENEDASYLNNYTGLDVFGIGNAFVTNYSISAAVSSIPTASVSFDAVNIVYQTYTGYTINNGMNGPELIDGTEIPAIRLSDGEKATGSYKLNPDNFDTSNYLSKQNIKPSALKPGNLILSLQQPVLGGVQYSGDVNANITSLQIDIPLERKDLNGFGSNYPYDKRIIFPLIGTLSFEGVFSKSVSGDFSNLFLEENNYDMSFYFKDDDQNTKLLIEILDCKIENQSFDLSIGDNLSFSSQFTFKVSESDGFRISGQADVYDSIAIEYFEAANITNETTKLAVNRFVKSLKNNTLWDKMSGIYPFIGGTANSHKFNLKNPLDSDSAYRLSFQGAGTIHTASGVEFLGSNDYANTFFNPNDNLSGNPVHISVLNLQDANVAGDSPDIGCQAQYGLTRFMLYLEADNTVAFDAYDYSTNRISISNPNSQAFYVGTKESNSVGHLLLFRNSIIPVQSAKNISMTSVSRPDYDLYIGAINNYGTASSASTSNRKFGFLSFGDGLTSGEAVKLYSAVKQLQLDLNRNTEIFI